MNKKSDFYTAKEKLGLLSLGDPGAGDKIQVTDTFLVGSARKLDAMIKQRPRLKRNLVRIKRLAQKLKAKASNRHVTPFRHANIPAIDIHTTIDSLKLRQSKKPAVSIVIPAYNRVEMSVACLASLAKLDDRVPFQTILIDNGSSDDTHLLKKIPGLTYVKNDQNLGFVGGCNSGIPAAKGTFILFLNNDTEVDKDWLYELYTTIATDDSIGIAGSKIIYPDGRLQEAGGVIFNDGSGLNYGKFDQANAYQYNYMRDVDYCSGASIIIRKDLLKSLGGFDTLYQPAYYEDTDLSFKVRSLNLRVVYQPRSVLFHIEGGTAGTNLNTGFKRFQEINKEKFFTRWKKTLQSSHFGPDDYYLGRDRSGEKLALIIEQTLPTPDKDSGSVRMMAMIKALQELGYKVTFWPNDLEEKEPYLKQMQQLGVEVVYGNIDFLQFSKHFASYYDLVIMSRPEICARYINIVKAHYTKAMVVYDTVDLHYLRLSRQAEIEPANAEALLEQSRWYKILETGLMERVDATFVVSDKEVSILKDEGVNHNILIVSNIHSIKDSAYELGFDDRRDAIFVGNYAHLPNQDSVLWLTQHVWPHVLKENSRAKLHIVGANMPEELRRSLSSSKQTFIHGFMSDEDLDSLLRKTRVFLAPLRYGAGVKGKIGQAIEYGIPVVSTTIGAEGMHMKDAESAYVADNVTDFAAKTNVLLQDKTTWNKLRDNARSIIDDHFSLAVAKKALGNLLKKH